MPCPPRRNEARTHTNAQQHADTHIYTLFSLSLSLPFFCSSFFFFFFSLSLSPLALAALQREIPQPSGKPIRHGLCVKQKRGRSSGLGRIACTASKLRRPEDRDCAIGGGLQPSMHLQQVHPKWFGSGIAARRNSSFEDSTMSHVCRTIFKTGSAQTQGLSASWGQHLPNEIAKPPFFPLFLLAAPPKMVFPNKGSLFARVTEQLSCRLQKSCHAFLDIVRKTAPHICT